MEEMSGGGERSEGEGVFADFNGEETTSSGEKRICTRDSSFKSDIHQTKRYQSNTGKETKRCPADWGSRRAKSNLFKQSRLFDCLNGISVSASHKVQPCFHDILRSSKRCSPLCTARLQRCNSPRG